MHIKNYHPASSWAGRIDQPEDIRFHQQVKLIDLRKEGWKKEGRQFVLLGFCCEEGVRRNQGRIGAAEGPAALRRAMASFAWHFGEAFHLLDGGDIICQGEELEEAQAALANSVAHILEQSAFPVVLGGGHDTAWGSYLGLRQALGAAPSVGVINIDAHLDLRTPHKGPNSGTPFWQMADWCKKQGTDFHYFCLGINPTGNTATLFAKARELRTTYITTDEMNFLSNKAIIEKLQSFIDQQDVLYLTIDLDGFDAAFAPGVSAPAALGLLPQKVLPLLRVIAASGKLKLCDVCELNPTYDIDQRTAKLGASLLFRLLDFKIE